MSQSGMQPATAPGRGGAAASLADFAPKNILVLGAEPQRATAALIEPVEEIYRLIGWQSADLPAEASPGQSAAALVQAVNRLETQFNISLWNEEEDRPRLHTYDPALVEGVGQAVAVAGLLPPLRVWMAGLSGGTSLIAGKEALAGALCNCVATYRSTPWRSTDELAAELEQLRPDVILAVGGYEDTDRRGQEQVLALCRHVIDAAVQLPSEDRPLFCFAGNRQSAQPALAYWDGRSAGSAAALAANVLAPDAGQRDGALAESPAGSTIRPNCAARSGRLFRRSGSGRDTIDSPHCTACTRLQTAGCTCGRPTLPVTGSGAVNAKQESRTRRGTWGCDSVASAPASARTFWPAGRRSAW